MENHSYRNYTNDDVYHIIRRALKKKTGNAINHEDLLKTAKEFGLDENDIEQAIRDEKQITDDEQIKEEWFRKEKSNFKNHLVTYGIMMTALFILNVFSGGNWWFQWPLFGGGIGIAFHFKSTYFPTEEEIEKAVKKLKKKKRYM